MREHKKNALIIFGLGELVCTSFGPDEDGRNIGTFCLMHTKAHLKEGLKQAFCTIEGYDPMTGLFILKMPFNVDVEAELAALGVAIARAADFVFTWMKSGTARLIESGPWIEMGSRRHNTVVTIQELIENFARASVLSSQEPQSFLLDPSVPGDRVALDGWRSDSEVYTIYKPEI